MPTRSTAVDAYIAQAAPFAQPILKKLRRLYHKACPQVTETMKWGFPHFESQGILGSMAAFKKHVSFGFWKGDQLPDPHGLLEGIGATTMAAVRVSDVKELPDDDILSAYIEAAARLNAESAAEKAARPKAEKSGSKPKKPKRPEAAVPDDLAAALRSHSAARATFDAFPPSDRREYVEWITSAKRPETRERRIATALEWLAEGKSRNWKYEKC